MLYPWVKTFHLLFVTSWFAGLFYLPRIFVNLAMVPENSDAERERLLLMSRKLYRFMGPLMVLALVFGLWLWLGVGIGEGNHSAGHQPGPPHGEGSNEAAVAHGGNPG